MSQEALNKVRWKVEECKTKGCWCGIIVPETPILDDRGEELYIIGAGCVPKENAKHIVKVHNESLQKPNV